MTTKEPKTYTIDDFKLVADDDLLQKHLEGWIEATNTARGGRKMEELPLPVWDRIAVQSAVANEWFETAPEGFNAESVPLMRRPVVRVLSLQITETYGRVNEPDENF